MKTCKYCGTNLDVYGYLKYSDKEIKICKCLRCGKEIIIRKRS